MTKEILSPIKEVYEFFSCNYKAIYRGVFSVLVLGIGLGILGCEQKKYDSKYVETHTEIPAENYTGLENRLEIPDTINSNRILDTFRWENIECMRIDTNTILKIPIEKGDNLYNRLKAYIENNGQGYVRTDKNAEEFDDFMKWLIEECVDKSTIPGGDPNKIGAGTTVTVTIPNSD